jgi:hypothetical protein
MFFGRRKKTINFKEPAYVENPLITFEWNKVLIVTDDGSVLVVETKPKRGGKKKEEESED